MNNINRINANAVDNLIRVSEEVVKENLDDIEVRIRKFCLALAPLAYYKAMNGEVCTDQLMLESMADHMYNMAMVELVQRWTLEEQYGKECDN